jgi:chorismate-pyruvate lyase
LSPLSYPSLETLFDAVPNPLPVPEYRFLNPQEIPEPYRHLLVHHSHMTIAQEKYHRCRIRVRVLQSQRFNGWYARQIVLLPQSAEKIVQGGMVRIHLTMLDTEVQKAIAREDTPLGHILINHDVLRRIEVTNFFQFMPGPAMQGWPGFDSNHPTYGRLGILYCDGQPAIELCEILPFLSPVDVPG